MITDVQMPFPQVFCKARHVLMRALVGISSVSGVKFMHTTHLSNLVSAKLRNSRYGNDEDLLTMMDNFERAVKPTFKDPSERHFVKFGSMRDRDPDVGIRSGQLPLEGYDQQFLNN